MKTIKNQMIEIVRKRVNGRNFKHVRKMIEMEIKGIEVTVERDCIEFNGTNGTSFISFEMINKFWK